MLLPPMPCLGRIDSRQMRDEIWVVLRAYPLLNAKGSYQLTTLSYVATVHGAWRAEHSDWLNEVQNPQEYNCVDFAHHFLADLGMDPIARTLPKFFVSGYRWMQAGAKRHTYPLIYCYRDELSAESNRVLVICDPQEAVVTTIPMAELAALDYQAVQARHGISEFSMD